MTGLNFRQLSSASWLSTLLFLLCSVTVPASSGHQLHNPHHAHHGHKSGHLHVPEHAHRSNDPPRSGNHQDAHQPIHYEESQHHPSSQDYHPDVDKPAHKRSFGKVPRVWTPSQGPHRRSSASSDGRPREPFFEDSNPGWSFTHVYDIPKWDGGDKAVCLIHTVPHASSKNTEDKVAPSDTETGPADVKQGPNDTKDDLSDVKNALSSSKDDDSAETKADLIKAALAKQPEHKRRNEAPSGQSMFCTHGNPPASVPDASVCKEREQEPKLTRRIIPTFGQIEQIVNNGIQAGEQTRLAALGQGGNAASLPATAPAGIGIGDFTPIPSFDQINQIVQNGIAAHRAVQLARIKAQGAGAGAGGSAPLPVAKRQGSPSSNDAKPLKSPSKLIPRSESSDVLNYQMLQLMSAGLKTDKELHSLEERSPMGPMMMMGGGAGMGQMLQEFMPLIEVGIKVAGEVGVALFDWLKQSDIDKTKLQIANYTKNAADEKGSGGKSTSLVGSSVGASGPSGSSSLAKSAGSSGGLSSSSSPATAAKSKRESARQAIHGDTPNPQRHLAIPKKNSRFSAKCGGSAQLCLQLIENTFHFCHPHSHHTSLSQGTLDAKIPQSQRLASSAHLETRAGDKVAEPVTFGETPTKLVRIMTTHCMLKCDGFKYLVEHRKGFKTKAESCAHDPKLFKDEHVAASLLLKHEKAGTKASVETKSKLVEDKTHAASPGVQSTLHKRDLSTANECDLGYQQLFKGATQPVPSYNGKHFGSVVSDPSSFLHWGLVRTTAQCLRACDDTKGCVFVNIYQQSFSLEHPDIKLVTREVEEATKREFAEKPEPKKSSFVQGYLTCALYSKCHLECEANHPSGGEDPVFFDHSDGYCKSEACTKGLTSAKAES